MQDQYKEFQLLLHLESHLLMLKKKYQAPNGITCAKPHVSKWRPNT